MPDEDGQLTAADPRPITGCCRSKPQPKKGNSLFFADERGHVSHTDPRQPELPLGVADINRGAASA